MYDFNYFENGSFSMNWLSENPPEKNKTAFPQNIYRKDLKTLQAELAEIKNRLQEIKAKGWELAKLIEFNHYDIAKE